MHPLEHIDAQGRLAWVGGFETPQAGENMYRLGGENRKRKEKGKNKSEIGKIRLKIEKRGDSRKIITFG